MSDSALTSDRRGLLIVLALPALGLALASTMVTTYLPVFIERLSGPALTGALIGAEGLWAMFLPPLIGSRSDRVRSSFGGRLPFIFAAAPLILLTLVLMPLVGSLPALAILILAFYAGYFTYYPPYRAMYPDLVRDEERGRSQGTQKTLREIGLVLALVGGGVLLSVWNPLPFLVAAVALAVVTVLFARALLRRQRRDGSRSGGAGGDGDGAEDPQSAIAALRSLLADRRIRHLSLANTLWEMALGAIKAFVILFFTIGVGRSESFASGVLALAAVAIIAAALIGGSLADRIGHRRLMRIAIPVYGVGLLAPLVSQSPFVIAVVPVIAFAGGIVMTLAFSLLMALMPERHHGSSAGLFELSRGMGALLGPAVAGAAISLSGGLLESTDGYAAMWAVASAAVLASLFVLRRAWREPADEARESPVEGRAAAGART